VLLQAFAHSPCVASLQHKHNVWSTQPANLSGCTISGQLSLLPSVDACSVSQCAAKLSLTRHALNPFHINTKLSATKSLQLRLLSSTGQEISSSLLAMGEGLTWLIGEVVCLLAASRVQLFAGIGNGWPHMVPRYQ